MFTSGHTVARILAKTAMNKNVHLITYANRLGSNLAELGEILDEEFDGLFAGVHLLPFFDPIDGEDAGFDPIDHRQVDVRIGGWSDIRSMAQRYDIMADLIVNHVSSESAQFVDVRRHGSASPYWPMFLRKSDVFDDSQTQKQQISEIYRPRPGSPFTTLTLGDGSEHEFWTTFSPNQLDIDVESEHGKQYLLGILDCFEANGIRKIRLDAAGYAIKRAGTRCFMLPETFDFIGQLSQQAADRGIQTLVEIHAHYQTQIDIASRVGRVYDFALPPLVLHSLYTRRTGALKRWLGMAPRNCVTVLDTHDGIGILDVARDQSLPGLLEDSEVETLVETIHEKTGDESRRASGHAASNLDVYQVNSTFYDALGRNDDDYVIARAIQLFCPGTPQIYYVGLLAGENDMALIQETDVGRDINRHSYTREEVRMQIERPVVKRIFELIELRNALSAFDGEFTMPTCNANELRLRWENKRSFAELNIDLGRQFASITYSENGALGECQVLGPLQQAAP